MAFARVNKANLRWTRGRPATFHSSSLAERGFCQKCGTPLTYCLVDGPNISVTACSLDDPETVMPEMQYSIERRLSWFATINDLPGRRTEEFITPDLAAGFVSYQHPDHDA
jgi:hypothetical protein